MARFMFCALAFLSVTACNNNDTQESPASTSKATAPIHFESSTGRRNRGDVELILDRVVEHALTDRMLRGAREFYGTPGQANIALVVDSKVAWPKEYVPSVKGFAFTYVNSSAGVDDDAPRLLGIELRRLELPPVGDKVEICLVNVGGNAGNRQVIGGCTVRYGAKKTEKGWEVEFLDQVD